VSTKNNNKHYGLELHVLDKTGRPPKGAEVAAVGKELSFDPDILNTYHYEGWAPVHHDLLLVCAAVEYADRRRRRHQTCWSRRFDVTVPVSQLRLWQDAKVQRTLREALRQLTGDDWHITFVQGNGPKDTGRQGVLPFPKEEKRYTIAYSDGLDSRCVSGLYPDAEIVRVRVAGKKERVGKGERPFDLIPFKVKPSPSPENSARSRGFKFAAITAIASHLAGVEHIVVPESGQGALGPVLLPLHNIYPDYRNHPAFFRKMERFIEALLGHRISYEQPRLWFTKGQTIRAYLESENAKRDGLLGTRSCWQERNNVRFGGKRWQCGLCAACLLRRMSMHAAGIDEPDTYAIENLCAFSYEAALPKHNSYQPTKTMIEYGSVGARHLQHLADMANLPDAELKVHAFDIARNTGATEEETLGNLKQLAAQHAHEWEGFINDLGEKSFMNRWIVGGRYGRSE